MQVTSISNRIIHRMIHNDTPHEIKVELYLRDNNSLDQCRGARYVYLPPYQTQDVEVGDFRNANLNGIKLMFEVGGEKITHRQMITSNSSELDKMLNQYLNIRIDSVSPVKLTGFDE